jgi:hypothetical protein
VKKHWLYLKYVLRHKYHVYRWGRRFGVGRWQLLKHDLSKFLPSEWFPYVNHFYGDRGESKKVRDETGYYKPTDTGDPAFDFAWLLHQKRNRHHWQWWVLPEDDGGTKALEIEYRYLFEMLADWFGAGAAQGTPDSRKWYEANKGKMQLHPKSRVYVERALYSDEVTAYLEEDRVRG